MILNNDIKNSECFQELTRKVDTLQSNLEDAIMRIHVLERKQDPSQYVATEKKAGEKVTT